LPGHRELYNQAQLACKAHGAGQHRDYALNYKGNLNNDGGEK